MTCNYFLILIVAFLTLTSCEEGAFSSEKVSLPTDHTENQDGFFHKPGAEFPFSFDENDGNMNCASSKCHQEDLKGGKAKINDKKTVAPSCYQCHGKLWYDINDLKGK